MFFSVEDLPSTTEESRDGEVAAAENFPAPEKAELTTRPRKGRHPKAAMEDHRPNVEVIRVHNRGVRVGVFRGEELLRLQGAGEGRRC